MAITDLDDISSESIRHTELMCKLDEVLTELKLINMYHAEWNDAELTEQDIEDR